MSHVVPRKKPRSSASSRTRTSTASSASSAKKHLRSTRGGSRSVAQRTPSTGSLAKPKVRPSVSAQESEIIWKSLTPSQRNFVYSMALKQNPNIAYLSGGSFFGSIGRFLKKAGPKVLRAAAPIAIGIATRAAEKAITKKLGGSGLRLAGRGSRYPSKLL